MVLVIDVLAVAFSHLTSGFHLPAGLIPSGSTLFLGGLGVVLFLSGLTARRVWQGSLHGISSVLLVLFAVGPLG